jgi:uncharacterized protein
MLHVDLRELAQGPVETRAELGATDPLLEGLDVALGGPVVVGGRLQATGEGRFYWHGTLRTVVTGECRRCLSPVAVAVTTETGALFTHDREALEDPDAYRLAPDATEIDLTPAIREELLLAVPRFVLCREDCRGLCPRCGRTLNAGPCGCAPAADPRWRALESLKERGHS